MMNLEQIQQIKKESSNFVTLVQNLKAYHVTHFITDAKTSSTTYFNQTESIVERGQYNFPIAPNVNVTAFVECLKSHQRGEIDFPTWLECTTKSGIASWEVSLIEKTCTYFDLDQNACYVEVIQNLE